jgi:hypothetical protein
MTIDDDVRSLLENTMNPLSGESTPLATTASPNRSPNTSIMRDGVGRQIIPIVT